MEFRGRVKRRGGPDLGLSRQAAQTDLRSQRPLPAGVCASPSRPLAGRVWQSEGPGAAGLGEPGSPSCPLLPGDPRFQGTVLYPGPPSSRAQLLARPPRPEAPVSRPHGGPGASRAPQRRGGCCRAVPQQGPRGPSRAAPPPPPAPLPAARLRARRRPATRPLRRLAARLQLSQPVSQRPLTAPRLGREGRRRRGRGEGETRRGKAGRTRSGAGGGGGGGAGNSEGGGEEEEAAIRRGDEERAEQKEGGRARGERERGGYPGTSSSSECLQVRPAQGYLRLPGVWPAARGTLSW